jgi:hypothetical protein
VRKEVKLLSGKVNLDRILRTCESRGSCEVEETVGEWAFAIDYLPVKLRIKVVYMALKRKFKATSNYKIQNPEQESPYTSISVSDTVEEALNDALRGFLVCWRPEKYKENTRLVPVEDW